MSRFATVRDAKEYLIGRIVEQAHRDGVPLSDIERKMLYFSETGWTMPDMMEVSRDFDEHYDQDEYESKIGGIVRRICDQADGQHGEWSEAVQRLRDEDHYLLVLIDGTVTGPLKRPRGDIAKLMITGAVVAACFVPILFFVDSHVSSRIASKWIGEGVLLVLVVLAAFLANRGRRRSA